MADDDSGAEWRKNLKGKSEEIRASTAAEPDAVEQMVKQRARKIGAANLRHQAGLAAP